MWEAYPVCKQRSGLYAWSEEVANLPYGAGWIDNQENRQTNTMILDQHLQLIPPHTTLINYQAASDYQISYGLIVPCKLTSK